MLPMLRGTFFSIGMFITLWGVSLLFVDKLVLNMPDDAAGRNPGFRGMYQGNQPGAKAESHRSARVGGVQPALGRRGDDVVRARAAEKAIVPVPGSNAGELHDRSVSSRAVCSLAGCGVAGWELSRSIRIARLAEFQAGDENAFQRVFVRVGPFPVHGLAARLIRLRNGAI